MMIRKEEQAFWCKRKRAGGPISPATHNTMARMHSRKHGKAKSRRPIGRPKPDWVSLKDKEVEEIIVKLAKEGKTPSQIGMLLRDNYGVPDVKAILGKRMSAVLDENKIELEFPEDLQALIKKAVMIRKHLETNIHDQPAKRGLTLTESKIMRLTKYYKANGVVETSWNYNPKDASYLVE